MPSAHVICYNGPGQAPTSTNTPAVTATVGAAVAVTGASNSTPFGYTTAAQANDLVARCNQMRADILALTTLVNQLRGLLV